MSVEIPAIILNVKTVQEASRLQHLCQQHTPQLRVYSLTKSKLQFSFKHLNLEKLVKGVYGVSMETNRGAWINASVGKTEITNRLSKSGVAVNWGEVRDSNDYCQYYKVSLFRLKAIQIIKLSPAQAKLQGQEQEGEQIQTQPIWTNLDQPDRDSKRWSKLEMAAIRACYALGLDTGEVTISIAEDQPCIVHHVIPYPDLTEESTAITFLNAISKVLSHIENENNECVKPALQIGMDPEFILFDPKRGKVVPAAKFLNRIGNAGCDSVRIEGRLRFPLAELRPEPAQEPRQLMKHLLGSFRTAYNMISDRSLIWQAGGMPRRGFCLGGHLHFSGVTLTPELLHVLDNYLALLVFVLEDGSSLKRRPRYGFLGDFRIKDYGGFEYRTLPSFLISPLVTKGVLALVKLIMIHHKELNLRPLADEVVYDAFYQGDQAVIRKVIPPLIKQIKFLSSYSQYEKYIDPLFKAISSEKTWDEQADIRQSWKLEIIL
ncbi:hypothetical protein J2Z32_002349 [Paenibacillus turicensis]|uniref:Phage phiEco32-like COOH-NH2 ligase-type 2 n=1 Tax=Paenibacillus turicensis TaxID=160487 RepID=A0ABS4FT19_9BACL|nr:hypothetical protein [Paenibacillus turicensis]